MANPRTVLATDGSAAIVGPLTVDELYQSEIYKSLGDEQQKVVKALLPEKGDPKKAGYFRILIQSDADAPPRRIHVGKLAIDSRGVITMPIDTSLNLTNLKNSDGNGLKLQLDGTGRTDALPTPATVNEFIKEVKGRERNGMLSDALHFSKGEGLTGAVMLADSADTGYISQPSTPSNSRPRHR